MQTILNYDEYINLGGNADNNSFPLLALRTQKVLEKATNGRINDVDDEMPIEVKACAAQIINLYYNLEKASQNTGVTSYSNGIESISYTNSIDAQHQTEDLINKAIIDYLPSDMLYRGRRQIT